MKSLGKQNANQANDGNRKRSLSDREAMHQRRVDKGERE
jgi:hypothetical protein